MPVVINDLEVIAPPPRDPQQEAQEPRRKTRPQPGPTPEDIYLVMRRMALRQLRLHAD